jgi:hypothetical protein
MVLLLIIVCVKGAYQLQALGIDWLRRRTFALCMWYKQQIWLCSKKKKKKKKGALPCTILKKMLLTWIELTASLSNSMSRSQSQARIVIACAGGLRAAAYGDGESICSQTISLPAVQQRHSPCENFISIAQTLIARMKSVFPELLAPTTFLPSH